MNKCLLSDQEQNEVLVSLQNLNALDVPDVELLLNKLTTLFNKESMNWIDIDFSHWGSTDDNRQRFSKLKKAILKRRLVTFDYFSSNGEETKRKVEPLKIFFKEHNWYFYGYCHLRSDFRMFKINRVKNLGLLNEPFERKITDGNWQDFKSNHMSHVTLKIKFDKTVAYRVYDEFDPSQVQKNNDGSLYVTATFPESEWIYGDILSYGCHAEVISPKRIREIIRKKFKDGLKNYL